MLPLRARSNIRPLPSHPHPTLPHPKRYLTCARASSKAASSASAPPASVAVMKKLFAPPPRPLAAGPSPVRARVAPGGMWGMAPDRLCGTLRRDGISGTRRMLFTSTLGGGASGVGGCVATSTCLSAQACKRAEWVSGAQWDGLRGCGRSRRRLRRERVCGQRAGMDGGGRARAREHEPVLVRVRLAVRGWAAGGR